MCLHGNLKKRRRKKAKKKLQVSNVKTKGFFFKSLSQMIQKCLIRREIAKNNFQRKMAVFGGSDGSNLQNQKLRVCYHKTQLLDTE